jgi:hypothetical protein
MQALLKKARYYTLSQFKRRLDRRRLKAITPIDSFQFPPEFDEATYKKCYKDLAQYSNSQLYAHYKNQGEKEGRRANALKNRIDFVKLIPSGKKILEIGPFLNPLTFGDNVFYFDILNQEALKLKAKSFGISKAEIAACPKIHFVSPTGDLNIINEKFDVVLSSHCIEHNLI